MEDSEKPAPAKHLLEDVAHLTDRFWVIIIKKRRWLKWLFVGLASLVAVIAALVAAVFALMFAIYIVLHFPGEIRITNRLILHFPGELKGDDGKPLDLSKLGHRDYKKESVVRAKNGQIIWRYFDDEVRDPIKLGEVPPLLVQGFLAAEDQRFYSHGGVDYRAMARAVVNNAVNKAGWHYMQRSGASTVTQQLARRLYVDEVGSFGTLEQSYQRKILEGRLAIELEKKYTKNQILEGFLNIIWLGDGAYGVAEAVHHEFGKDIRKDHLTPREVAILVARNKSPEKYSPTFHAPKKPERKPGMTDAEFKEQDEKYQAKLLEEMRRLAVARDRVNYVLGRMLKNDIITQKDYDAALFDKDDPPNLDILHPTPFKNPEFGHAARMVKELLFMQGYKDNDILSRAGLQITASINPAIQTIVTEEVERQYRELNTEITTKAKIEGSVIVIENKTGKIVALVGGHNFGESQFNRVLSLRSPGSLFKVITIADAIENHEMNLETMVCNCPFSLPAKIDIHGRVMERWAPENFEEKNPVPIGLITIWTVLTRSVNLGALDTARRDGIKSIIATANKMGVHGYENEVMDPDGEVWFKRARAKNRENSRRGLEPYLPTAIGASGASLLELAGAFTVLARGGTYIRPTIIQEIRDSDGNLLYQAPEQNEKRVLSERTATLITAALRGATKVGTSKISMRGIEQQVACKTGTSNGPNDVSIACYTPEYTMITRWGYDAPKPIVIPEYMKRVSGDPEMQVSGGWVAGRFERRAWDRIYQHRPKVSFSPIVEEAVNAHLGETEN